MARKGSRPDRTHPPGRVIVNQPMPPHPDPPEPDPPPPPPQPPQPQPPAPPQPPADDPLPPDDPYPPDDNPIDPDDPSTMPPQDQWTFPDWWGRPPAPPGGLIPWLAGLIAAVLIVSSVVYGITHQSGQPVPAANPTATVPSPAATDLGTAGTPPPLPPDFFLTVNVNSFLTSLNSPRPAGTTPCPFQWNLTVTVTEHGQPPTGLQNVEATVSVDGGPPLPIEIRIPVGGDQSGVYTGSWVVGQEGSWTFSNFKAYGVEPLAPIVEVQTRPLDPPVVVNVSCAPV